MAFVYQRAHTCEERKHVPHILTRNQVSLQQRRVWTRGRHLLLQLMVIVMKGVRLQVGQFFALNLLSLTYSRAHQSRCCCALARWDILAQIRFDTKKFRCKDVLTQKLYLHQNDLVIFHRFLGWRVVSFLILVPFYSICIYYPWCCSRSWAKRHNFL